MKAVVCIKYGPLEGLQFKEVEKPAPKDDEILVKVHASSVNYNNVAHIIGKPFGARAWFGMRKPKLKIPGNDVAGQVEAVGSRVTMFQPGDEVFGDVSACGFGAYAEYVCRPEGAFVLKPANLSFTEAATVPEAAVVALQGLRKGRIQSGQKVLIYGASGGIGTFAVQIAKSFGTDVTGVCSTRNLDMVRSIGADHVIDYTQEDSTRNGRRYDLILVTAGHRSIVDYRRALSPKGNHVVTGGAMSQIFQALLLGPWMSMVGSKKTSSITAKPDNNDLLFMKELLETGKVVPVIDRCYPFSELAEALRYYGKGHAHGKVVITIG